MKPDIKTTFTQRSPVLSDHNFNYLLSQLNYRKSHQYTDHLSLGTTIYWSPWVVYTYRWHCVLRYSDIYTWRRRCPHSVLGRRRRILSFELPLCWRCPLPYSFPSSGFSSWRGMTRIELSLFVDGQLVWHALESNTQIPLWTLHLIQLKRIHQSESQCYELHIQSTQIHVNWLLPSVL